MWLSINFVTRGNGCLSVQLASDEESVQSLNIEDHEDHTGKKYEIKP